MHCGERAHPACGDGADRGSRPVARPVGTAELCEWARTRRACQPVGNGAADAVVRRQRRISRPVRDQCRPRPGNGGRRSPRWASGRDRAGSYWRPRAASDVTILDALPFGTGVAFAALIGLILGSFIATLVLRWPAGRSVLGRSQCDGCQRPLGAIDLIPLLSALWSRGRCRRCGAPHRSLSLAGRAGIGADRCDRAGAVCPAPRDGYGRCSAGCCCRSRCSTRAISGFPTDSICSRMSAC
jgi:hypothetical protein